MLPSAFTTAKSFAAVPPDRPYPLRADWACGPLYRAVEVTRRERPIPDVRTRQGAASDIDPVDGAVLNLSARDERCGRYGRARKRGEERHERNRRRWRGPVAANELPHLRPL